MNAPIKLVPGKSDKEIAEGLRSRVIEAWQPLLLLMEEANQGGFNISVTAQMTGMGKAIISNVTISKNF